MGDALGVPHEFKPARSIPPAETIQLEMPPGYRRTYHGVPYGTWSDDGSQLLCLLQSLSDNAGTLNLTDFGKQLVRWRKEAWHQAGGTVFDCGVATGTALSRLAGGIPAEKAGSASERSLGNGSLMRVLPAALAPCYWGVPAADVISIAATQSIVTHAHPIALMCCAIYAQLAYLWLLDPAVPVAAAVASAASEVSKHPIAADPAMQVVILKIVEAIGDGQPSGSGYCVSTLATAVWSIEHSNDYLSVVRSVIQLGGDTDTTACVTGGLAAIRYGLDSVPDDWWPQLDMPSESRKLLKSLAR